MFIKKKSCCIKYRGDFLSSWAPCLTHLFAFCVVAALFCIYISKIMGDLFITNFSLTRAGAVDKCCRLCCRFIVESMLLNENSTKQAHFVENVSAKWVFSFVCCFVTRCLYSSFPVDLGGDALWFALVGVSAKGCRPVPCGFSEPPSLPWGFPVTGGRSRPQG